MVVTVRNTPNHRFCAFGCRLKHLKHGIISRSKCFYSAFVLAVIIGLIAPPMDYAQSSADTDTASAWHIDFTYGSANLFLLMCPSIGLECEFGYYDNRQEGRSPSLDAGIRFALNNGDTSIEESEFTYVDYILWLAEGVQIGSHSFALLSGLGYRDWGKLRYKSGSIISIGVEWSYPLIDNRMMLQFRAIAAFRPNGSIEYGPMGLGLAIGWFRY